MSNSLGENGGSGSLGQAPGGIAAGGIAAGGGVASVTAGDSTITIGGTATNPTVQSSAPLLTILSADNQFIAISVTEEGIYLLEFDGVLKGGGAPTDTLELQLNNASAVACRGGHIINILGVTAVGIIDTTAVLYDDQGTLAANNQVSLKGTFSYRNGKLSGYEVTGIGYDGVNTELQRASGLFVPTSGLTSVRLKADVALGIISGSTLRIKKLGT